MPVVCVSVDALPRIRAPSRMSMHGGGRQRIDYMAMLGLVRAATLRRQLIDAISPQCGAYKGQPRMENESPPRKENFNYRLTDGFGLPLGKRCSSIAMMNPFANPDRSGLAYCFSFLSTIRARTPNGAEMRHFAAISRMFP